MILLAIAIWGGAPKFLTMAFGVRVYIKIKYYLIKLKKSTLIKTVFGQSDLELIESISKII